ncbi:hypothetical protein EUGRSUZ_E00488 [Eucalyptus grandis]|uniref:Clp R domain-containing protein n=3 Tax=Eucalyptus TaxID=3932 RepID=A0A059C1H1_EUCGR|nr:hypothetical protein EUGRSUZ_E00488 [Eucalyptus grandis]
MASHALSKLPPSTAHARSAHRPGLASSFGLPNAWLGARDFSLRSAGLACRPPRPRPIIATVAFSLPTAKPERVSSGENVPRWSRRAIKSFAMGELEARKLKYPTTGTEALLMGLLIEGTNSAAKLLRANGITLFKVREESMKLIPKGDMYFFSPEHPPLTEDCQRVLDWAVDHKLKSADGGEITTSHLLLGIWYEVDSLGHKILAALGFDDSKAKELESQISKPEYEG